VGEVGEMGKQTTLRLLRELTGQCDLAAAAVSADDQRTNS
jgi:hypothetical protein